MADEEPEAFTQDAEEQDDRERHRHQRGDEREHTEDDTARRLDGVVGGNGTHLADHALDSVGEVGGPVWIGEGITRHGLEPTRRFTRG